MPLLKPVRAIQINKSHPLARRLVGCWLFNEGTGRQVCDLTGSENTILFDENPDWVAEGVQCDGISESLYINNRLSQQVKEFTLIVCFQIHEIPQENDRFFEKEYKDATEDPYVSWGFEFIGGKIRLLAARTPSYVGNILDWSVTLNQDQWYTLAGVYSATSGFAIYSDGVLVASDNTRTGDIIYYSTTGNQIDIWGQLNTSYYIKATIKYALFFGRSLSAAEIAHLYREPFCMFERATSPAILFVPTIDLAGTSTAQSSTFATVKRVRRIRGSCSATAETSTILKIVAEVLLAGSIYASVLPLGKLTLSYRGPWLKSPLKIERQWLTDTLLLGMTANAFKLGTALSGGWFWMRPTGCCVLYRGHSMEQIDFTNILAVVELGAEIMSLPSYVPHCSSSTYFYVVRRFNICGYQERTLAAAVKVSIDAQGSLAQPQPNNIFAARADQVAGNKVQLTWFYCPLEQKSQPMRFKVYCDSATGKIDYENPIATIGYGGQKFYSYQNDALPAGRYLFAIRAEDAGGVVNNSLAQLAIQISTQSPDVIDILSAEVI